MARKERVSRGWSMRPNFFVFCEGDTEVVYVEMLRSYYRLPIQIIAKKTLLNVTPELVERCKALYIQTTSDRTYLMYDLDVEGMLDRLKKVTDAVLLCSNPCFELWPLLHYTGVKAELSSMICMKRLEAALSGSRGVKQSVAGYKKGVLPLEMCSYLMEHWKEAAERAKVLAAYGNPSTTVYQLLEDMERVKYNIIP